MTAKENMIKTIQFQCPERVAHNLHPSFESDMVHLNMYPNPDHRPTGKKGISKDEWGAVWENIGLCSLGEVKEYPLKNWSDFDNISIPDVDQQSRWTPLAEEIAGVDQNKFLISYGISIYERIHFLRGLENTWEDIYLEPDNLKMLIDILVDMNLKAIKHYARLGVNGYFFADDWGLQDRLMIPPDKWREFWKPAYTTIYNAAHKEGMLTFLHSCGYILDILDDLIEAGLDVIQMDQQLNMGLDELSKYKGRITFWCPVDIQAIMPHAPMSEIKNYCHEMFTALATPQGGFIAKFYPDPQGAGHSPEAVDTMCREFLSLDYSQLTP